jgi:uncharacterized membrane protein
MLSYSDLNGVEQTIVRAIYRDPGSNQAEIQEATNLSQIGVSRTIKRLKDQGILDPVKSGRESHVWLTSQGEKVARTPGRRKKA